MTRNPYVFNISLFMDTPLLFNGDIIELWKARFENFINTNYFVIWDILNNGSFITIFCVNDEGVNKPNFDWIKEDLWKVKHVFKVKQILINALSSKLFKYLHVSPLKKCGANWTLKFQMIMSAILIYGTEPLEPLRDILKLCF